MYTSFQNSLSIIDLKKIFLILVRTFFRCVRWVPERMCSQRGWDLAAIHIYTAHLAYISETCPCHAQCTCREGNRIRERELLPVLATGMSQSMNTDQISVTSNALTLVLFHQHCPSAVKLKEVHLFNCIQIYNWAFLVMASSTASKGKWFTMYVSRTLLYEERLTIIISGSTIFIILNCLFWCKYSVLNTVLCLD